MRHRMEKRRAFTLLEVVLASLITVLLMVGLYVALNMQYRYAESGRNAVDQVTLAQSLVQRIDDDISHQLGPLVINSYAKVSAGGSGAGAGAGGGAGTGGGGKAGGGAGGGAGASGANTGSANASSGASAGGSSGGAGYSSSAGSGSVPVSSINQTSGGSPSTASTTNTGNTGAATGTSLVGTTATNAGTGPILFNLMVQGTNNQLTIYASRYPREVLSANDASSSQNNTAQNNTPLVSDIRQITYWLASGTGKSSGLCRYEIKQETSNDALNATTDSPPSVPDLEACVISSRVKSLTFSYWDGQNWQDSWDGTMPTGSDAVTPQGPPMAIKVEMKVAPAPGDGADDSKNWKTHQQTIYIPTANRLILLTNQTPLGTTGQ